MKKILINHTNHPSNKWKEEQKEKWDSIIDIPFPEIPPEIDTNDQGFRNLIISNLEKILKIYKENSEDSIFVILQGEYTYCYLMFEKLKEHGLNIAIPTTKRLVTENPDGTRTYSFEFVRWRIV